MNLREIVEMDRIVGTDRLSTLRQPVGRGPGPWLACYPLFRDALSRGETTFQALSESARRLVLGRTTVDMGEQAIASNILDDVCVAAIELATDAVDQIVNGYLGGQEANGNGASGRSSASLLRGVTPGFAATDYPLIARPPCLLRPGHHVFLDSWMRFLSYRSRGDRTIPLLAIDWLDFHHRLSALADRTCAWPAQNDRVFARPG